MNGDVNEALTAEDLKGKIFHSIKESGIIDNLKGQLRKSMINNLRTRSSINGNINAKNSSNLLSATMYSKKGDNWIQKVLDNLILHHIKRSNYHYTLSLFQQESGLKKYSKSLVVELLKKVGIKPNDIKNKSLILSDYSINSTQSTTTLNEESWIIWEIMTALSEKSCDKIQNSTTEAKVLSLADKLQAVDNDLVNRCHKPTVSHESVTSLHSAVREAEKEVERRYKMIFEQWKLYELTKVKTTEAENSKKMIDARVKELETDYRQRVNALENREKNAVERLNNHRKSLEAELHNQRQKLLHEMELLRSRENIVLQQEKHVQKMESMRIKDLDMLKAATIFPKQTEKEDSSINEILFFQMEKLSKENETLKSEINELKKTFNIEDIKISNQNKTSLSSNFYIEQNERLRTRINEMEKIIDDLKIERIQNDSTEDLRLQVTALNKMKDQQDQRQLKLEEMIEKMKAAIQNNSRAMMENINPTYLESSSNLLNINDNYDLCLSKPKKSSKNLLEYEDLDNKLLLNQIDCQMKENNQLKIYLEDNTTHKICTTRERLKNLQAQSDVLEKEFTKFNQSDFHQKLSATKKQFTKSCETILANLIPDSVDLVDSPKMSRKKLDFQIGDSDIHSKKEIGASPKPKNIQPTKISFHETSPKTESCKDVLKDQKINSSLSENVKVSLEDEDTRSKVVDDRDDNNKTIISDNLSHHEISIEDKIIHEESLKDKNSDSEEVVSDPKDNASSCSKIDSNPKDNASSCSEIDSNPKDNASSCSEIDSNPKDNASSCSEIVLQNKDTKNLSTDLVLEDNDKVSMSKEQSRSENSPTSSITSSSSHQNLKNDFFSTSEETSNISIENKSQNKVDSDSW